MADWKGLKSEVRRRADVLSIFDDLGRLSEPSEDGWSVTLCPFHEDSEPSFSFNLGTGSDETLKGVWKCFVCSDRAGSVFDYWAKKHGLNFKESLLDLADLFEVDPKDFGVGGKKSKGIRKKKRRKKKPAPTRGKRSAPKIPKTPDIDTDDREIDHVTVDGWYRNLRSRSNEDRLSWMIDKKGISREILDRFRVGYSSRSKRYVIPVIDDRGVVRNARLYDPASPPEGKVRNYIRYSHGEKVRYGSPIRLFNLPALEKSSPSDPVLVVEGEVDCMTASQHGFTAVSSTGGCRSFRREWEPHFKGRHVVVLYDVDESGRKAAVNTAAPVLRTFDIESLKVAFLPLPGTPDLNDLTDFFVKHGGTADELRSLIEATEPIPLSDDPKPADVIELDTFARIEEDELIGKKVRCVIVASGETSESFHAACEFKIEHCRKGVNGLCPCTFKAKGGAFSIPPSEREYIGSCMTSDEQVMRMLRSYVCKEGQRPILEITGKKTITEFFCHQQVERMVSGDVERGSMVDGATGQAVLDKRVYYLSHDRPKPGAYMASGWVTSVPRSQQITMLIEDLERLDDDFEQFDVEEYVDELEMLRGLTVDEIIEFLTLNVIRIYKRPYMILAMMLTFVSPRWLRFNEELIRGWMNTLIVGDAGCGKTVAYQNFARWVGIGDEFSGLTGSRTGLVYGLQEHKQKGWQVRIGRYPANTRRILMVDEAHVLDERDLRTLAKAMDEGWLQVDRISSGGYESQTRLLIVSNPKDERVMDDFTHGCEAIKQLLNPPVVRRLDLAVITNSSDISDLDVINRSAREVKRSDLSLTSSHFRSLIYWAWNMEADDVIFDEETTSAVLDAAKELSVEYGDAHDVPIVDRSNVRNKIARISAAFAVLDVSVADDDGRRDYSNLTVTRTHVQATVRLMKKLYGNPNFQLDVYSRVRGIYSSMDDYDQIARAFVDRKIKDERNNISGRTSTFALFIKTIFSHHIMRRYDLAEIIGVDIRTVQRYMSPMRRFGLIGSSKNGYYKTKKFNRFFKQFMKENPDFLDCVDDERITFFDSDDERIMIDEGF